jgi:RNA recognition motif-containing protein
LNFRLPPDNYSTGGFFISPCTNLKRGVLHVETKIYVGNLSFDTTEDELRELFAQAGAVASVALIKDRDSGRSKGFAFVEMSNQADAENAIRMFNGKTFGNRELKVNLARPREERSFGGGYGGGYGRGGGRGSGQGSNRRGSGGGQRRY